MSQYHESENELSVKTKDLTRALISLKEEIEAIDWYNQRIDCADNDELRGILEHNRDEEIEHACMAIEWLRKNMAMWDENLREYLFSDGDVTSQEEEQEETKNKDLNIGSIK